MTIVGRMIYIMVSLFLLPVYAFSASIIDYDFNDRSWGILGHGAYWTMEPSGGVGNTPATRLAYTEDGTAGKALALNTTSIASNTFWIEFDVKVEGVITGGSKFIKFFGSRSTHSQNNMTIGIDYYAGTQKEVAYYGDTICTARWDGTNGGFCTTSDNLSGAGGAIDIGGGGWGHYKVWVKRADPGACNGAVKVWWNGVLMGDVSDMNSNPVDRATDFIETIEFGGYNHSNFSDTWYLWIDNLYVGTTEKGETPVLPPESSIIQWDAQVYPVDEGAGTVHLTLSRTGDISGNATIEWRTSQGVAMEDVDYEGVDWTPVTLTDGEESKVVTVQLI